MKEANFTELFQDFELNWDKLIELGFITPIKKESKSKKLKSRELNDKIILDFELSKNDLAVYLAIVRNSSKKAKFKTISNKLIEELTGISQTNQSRSVKKLSEKGYIEYIRTEYSNKYLVEVNPKKATVIKLNAFNTLAEDKTSFIRHLRGFVICNGKKEFPSLKAAQSRCTGNLTREEYNQMRLIYESGI